MTQASNQTAEHCKLQGRPNDWASGTMNPDFPPSITEIQTRSILILFSLVKEFYNGLGKKSSMAEIAKSD